jgi:hypothetical protein
MTSGTQEVGPDRWLAGSVFLLSAVGLAYEIALTRILSMAQWSHCAYMAISVAMLGFGAAGTAVALVRHRIREREREVFPWVVAAVGPGVSGSYALSQAIPFEAFELVSQPVQSAYLGGLYLVLAVPFFLVSAAVALAFLVRPDRVGRVYFAGMTGSGFGAAGVVSLLYVLPAARVPLLLSLLPLGLLPFLCCGRRVRGWCVGGGLAILCTVLGCVPVRVSSYKGLSYALQYPDAEVVAHAYSPLSDITAVASSRIRETPGQISNYPMETLGPLPPQIGLFFDGAGPSVVNRFAGSFTEVSFLDYVTAALPYRLLESPRTLVIGGGGGSDVLMALMHGADGLTVVEVDPRVFAVVNDELGSFSGALYRRSDVTSVVADGRQYLAATEESYDLVHVALLDSFNATAAGVHALGESYLYTVEAFEAVLNRLSPGGLVAVTRWLTHPPRDAVKLLATLVAACEAAGLDPGGRLAFIRSWNTGTLLMAREPWSEEQRAAIRAFCQERRFDLCYLPGLEPEEANRYTMLDEPYYYLAARSLLSSERDQYFRDSLFHVRPATDDKPHFFRFFKWAALPRLVRGMGTEWVPFVEWGYLALALTLAQALVLSVALILLPLVFTRSRPLGNSSSRAALRYFGLIGLGYMCLEIAFIQKFMLLLAYPVLAVGVVLSAFLLFSGCGSFVCDWAQASGRPLVRFALGWVGGLAVAYLFLLPWLFEVAAGCSLGLRVALSLALLGPLAFCMGFPFPYGLQKVADRMPGLIPWAWGVNGCASVVGAVLATWMAVHVGFSGVIVLALLLYAAAGMALPRLEREKPMNS